MNGSEPIICKAGLVVHGSLEISCRFILPAWKKQLLISKKANHYSLICLAGIPSDDSDIAHI